ncbi:REP element-mobilizing transposase RayT [Alteromonadaceae bacterium Bs31]|nr:REP element-mobilizing transposase RayT [Alteromonadaceae bacterium Bs31]
MPRKPRASVVGVPEQVIQQGDNRQVIFTGDAVKRAYANWLKDYAVEFGVAVHALVLMSNHVHLLRTPGSNTAISSMMQALDLRYVQYFNRSYQRSGTLWEGRFRSCLVQEDPFLLLL